MRNILMLLVLALTAVAARAATGDDPHFFVSRVIAYETSGKTNMRSRTFLSMLTPGLRTAVQTDMAGDEIGVLDADPICQCQDDDRLRMRVIAFKRSHSAVWADIESMFASDARRARLKLTHTPSGWLIADIATREQPSLLAVLEASNYHRR